MGIFLIGIFILILGLLLFYISRNKSMERLCYASISIIAIAFGWLLISGQYAINVQSAKAQNYKNARHQRDSIEYRILERAYIDKGVDKVELYADIVEFNHMVTVERQCSNSFWTNWYANDLIAELEYIPIDDTYPRSEVQDDII